KLAKLVQKSVILEPHNVKGEKKHAKKGQGGHSSGKKEDIRANNLLKAGALVGYIKERVVIGQGSLRYGSGAIDVTAMLRDLIMIAAQHGDVCCRIPGFKLIGLEKGSARAYAYRASTVGATGREFQSSITIKAD